MKVVNPQYQQSAAPVRLTTPTHYRIRHHTRFRYSSPIMESFMEVRMEPLNDSNQRNHSFSMTTDPESRIMRYQDYAGNFEYHPIPGNNLWRLTKQY